MAQLSKEELVLALLDGNLPDDDLLHYMIFDLRAPVNNIIGGMEMLAETSSPKDRELLERLKAEAAKIQLYFDAFSEYRSIRKGFKPDPRTQPPETSDK